MAIDANVMLAGVAIKLNLDLLAVQAGTKSLQLADFALGCFWGAPQNDVVIDSSIPFLARSSCKILSLTL